MPSTMAQVARRKSRCVRVHSTPDGLRAPLSDVPRRFDGDQDKLKRKYPDQLALTTAVLLKCEKTRQSAFQPDRHYI